MVTTLDSLLAQPAAWGWWDGPAGPAHAGGGWFWIWPLAWLAFWAVLLGLLGWYLVRGRHRSSLHEARRILAERYARGDLSGDEYRERLGQLR
jgi:putative membrane protein